MKIDLSADIDNLAYLNYMQEQEDKENQCQKEDAAGSDWMVAGAEDSKKDNQ